MLNMWLCADVNAYVPLGAMPVLDGAVPGRRPPTGGPRRAALLGVALHGPVPGSPPCTALPQTTKSSKRSTATRASRVARALRAVTAVKV